MDDELRKVARDAYVAWRGSANHTRRAQLTAIDARLETLPESASKRERSYGDFLLEVVNAEADARRQRYLKSGCNWLICLT